jgi:3-methyl-2-oxobutanoate hydroxymethyltransferase
MATIIPIFNRKKNPGTKMKKHTTRSIKSNQDHKLKMLTCYDFQTAQLLNELPVDMILVGDSLGNVVLGYETTVSVTPQEMILFGKAVKKGAPDKFTILDVPFGVTASFNSALKICAHLFQSTGVEALKIEGANTRELKLIKRLTEIGIPVMGHIGLIPQSVHQLGGYYTHGKNPDQAKMLKDQGMLLQEAGCFSLVLECVETKVAKEITNSLSIPTIGIGSGSDTKGQVLVINDLLGLGKNPPPSFCIPIANLYEEKKKSLQQYLTSF